jgi:hypothetical protein
MTVSARCIVFSIRTSVSFNPTLLLLPVAQWLSGTVLVCGGLGSPEDRTALFNQLLQGILN